MLNDFESEVIISFYEVIPLKRLIWLNNVLIGNFPTSLGYNWLSCFKLVRYFFKPMKSLLILLVDNCRKKFLYRLNFKLCLDLLICSSRICMFSLHLLIWNWNIVAKSSVRRWRHFRSLHKKRNLKGRLHGPPYILARYEIEIFSKWSHNFQKKNSGIKGVTVVNAFYLMVFGIWLPFLLL